MKEVSERSLSLVIQVTKQPDKEPVIEARADYIVTSDGLEVTRSQPVTFAPATIKTLTKQALEQIRSAEGE